VGRTPLVLSLAGVVWLTILLMSVLSIGRKLGGGPGALGAVALTSSIPHVLFFARTAWIHIPEAALLFAGLAWYLQDPGLGRRRTVAILALTGALCISLRESGLVWTATMAPLVVFGTRARRPERPWARIFAIGTAWFIAALPQIIGLVRYLSRKLGARERYVLQTRPLLEQFPESLTPAIAYLALAGVLLFVIRMSRHWQASLPLLLSWATWVPSLMFLVFYAGFTNYTPFMPAVALVISLGLVWMHRWLAIIPVAIFIFQLKPQNQLFFLHMSGEELVEDLKVMRNPSRGWGPLDVARLLDASCPSDQWRSCNVVVDQGLFYPASEEFGLVPLFQLAEDRVALRTVYEEPPGGWKSFRIDALPVFRCRDKDESWRRRTPDALDRILELSRIHQLEVAYSDHVDHLCDVHWLTPKGSFLRAGVAPEPRRPGGVERISSTLLLQELQLFRQRNPQFANRKGHNTVNEPWREFPTQPEGWTAESASTERAEARESLK
jgi:hypothetical protein